MSEYLIFKQVEDVKTDINFPNNSQLEVDQSPPSFKTPKLEVGQTSQNSQTFKIEEQKKHLDLLFRPNDRIFLCGSLKEAGGYSHPTCAPLSNLQIEPEHLQFCIQPLTYENKNNKGAKSIRASINISNYRNFLFESDIISVEDQLNNLEAIVNVLPIRAVTYSGGKSLHYIISVADELICGKPGSQAANDLYKAYWKGLANELEATISQLTNTSSKILDQSTKDPIKLSRLAGAFRNKVEQSLVYTGPLMLSDDIYEYFTKVDRLNYGKINSTDAQMSITKFKSELQTPKNIALSFKLKYPKHWIASAGMYHELFKLALWAHDSTGVPYKTLEIYMQENIYPEIINCGYPRDPSIGVFNAYKWKNLI
jgi:hypothetical protein